MTEVYRQPNQPAASAPPEAEAKKVEPIVAPPLSMKPDEYGAKLSEQHERALTEEEKKLAEKQKNEVESMNHRHESEKKALADKREASKKEVEAVKEHVAMWQRQNEDTQHGAHDVRRNDFEQLELARKTGYEVRQDPGGDRIIPGFPQPLVKGQPWVRPVNSFDSSRLHPSF